MVKSTATTKKKAKKSSVKSTKRASSQASSRPFMETKITDQTLYWFIFGAAAVIFALWLFSLDSKVRDLYDQIDANAYSSQPAINMNNSSQE